MAVYRVHRRLSTPPSSSIILSLATLLLAVTTIRGQEDIDKAISEVFPPPNGVDPTPSTGVTGACTCVPYYLCNNNSINTDGAGLIDIRIKDGPCASYMDVCCDNPMNPSDTAPVSNEDKRINCGHWNSGGVGFRITGQTNEAQFGEFPWMVAILRIDPVNQGKNYLCGGSLIHPQVVLTAVHCVHDKNPEELVLRAGEWDSQTENELFPFQDRHATRVIKHEKYYGGALHNDVALIFVDTPYVLRDNVGTICLPSQGFTFSRERCYASGWGKNVFGKAGEYQVILKKIDLPIVPRGKCIDLLRKTRLGPNYKLHESFICAGGEIGKDTCQGDGGSPLMCPLKNNPDQFHQAGIVAWGIGCGDQTPGVYVDVALFRRWIDDQMNRNNLDTSYYDANYRP